jgi:hypothetical protein
MAFEPELMRRALAYTGRHGLVTGAELGAGVHGIVLAIESHPEGGVAAVHSAIKVHRREADYCRERDVYFRLKENAVSTIRGCHVPQLLRHDDQLWIIEMTVVSRPFILDFAGAFLDKAPGFSEEVIADWQAEKREQFEQRWPEVQAILRNLEAYGVFMIDVSPGNVSFND